MNLQILSSVSEFLPRKVKRAALLKAMLVHNGVNSETQSAKIFKAVGLHPSSTSDWLAREQLPNLGDLPKVDNRKSIMKWIEELPVSLRYETTAMLRRDVAINVRLVKSVS